VTGGENQGQGNERAPEKRRRQKHSSRATNGQSTHSDRRSSELSCGSLKGPNLFLNREGGEEIRADKGAENSLTGTTAGIVKRHESCLKDKDSAGKRN